MNQNSDQNCLLSRLWGNGSSPATLDLQAFRRTRFSSRLRKVSLQSNTFIKAMCGGNNDWDQGTPQVKRIKYAEKLDFTHLSVRPREIMNTRAITLNICKLKWRTPENRIASLTLPLNEIIYESIRKASGSLLTLLLAQESSSKPFLIITFENGYTGPDKAMKTILNNLKEKKYFAGGDLPLFCNKNDSDYYNVVVYPRSLSLEVNEAFQRRKNLKRWYENEGPFLRFCPYMKNFLTPNWRQVLGHYFVSLNCAFLNKPLSFSFPNDVESEMQKLLGVKLVEIDSNARWYDAWLTAFQNSLKNVENAPKKNNKQVKIKLVEEHFDRLRKQQRKQIPFSFLRRHQLIKSV